MSDFKPYLHSAHIEGYKSIVNCDVTFKPGLNIIIGKNGTGKTNLLEGINFTMEFDDTMDDAQPNLEARLRLIFGSTGQHEFIVILRKTSFEESIEKQSFLKAHKQRSKRIEQKIIVDGLDKSDKSIDREGWYNSFMFSHSIPKSIPFLNDFDAGWLVNPVISTQIIPNSWDGNALPSLHDLINMAIWARQLPPGPRLDQMEIAKLVIAQMDRFRTRLLPTLKGCTPVTAIRSVEGRINQGVLKDQIEVIGFHFLFEVNEMWLPFNNLSDGTKRVLLLVAEVFNFPSDEDKSSNEYVASLLIEEPELGIHPHQLHLLMNFLKEQSQQKQIILTTHSPEVLDILDDNEFDRIIIAEFNPENGSTFRHLTDAEIEKAQKYVEAGLQISDYWKFSDLEPHPIL